MSKCLLLVILTFSPYVTSSSVRPFGMIIFHSHEILTNPGFQMDPFGTRLEPYAWSTNVTNGQKIIFITPEGYLELRNRDSINDFTIISQYHNFQFNETCHYFLCGSFCLLAAQRNTSLSSSSICFNFGKVSGILGSVDFYLSEYGATTNNSKFLSFLKSPWGINQWPMEQSPWITFNISFNQILPMLTSLDSVEERKEITWMNAVLTFYTDQDQLSVAQYDNISFLELQPYISSTQLVAVEDLTKILMILVSIGIVGAGVVFIVQKRFYQSKKPPPENEMLTFEESLDYINKLKENDNNQ